MAKILRFPDEEEYKSFMMKHIDAFVDELLETNGKDILIMPSPEDIERALDKVVEWNELTDDNSKETLFSVEGKFYMGHTDCDSNWLEYDVYIEGINPNDKGAPPEEFGELPEDGTTLRLRLEKI